MPKTDEEEGLQKHTLNLFPGDYAKVQELNPDLGAAAIIRRLVRRYIEQVEGSATPNPTVEVKL